MPLPDIAAAPDPLRKVLLCIDDNESVLACYKAFLEAFGYAVLATASGRTGLELAARQRIDLVVLDYNMPEMNGQQVATELRRIRPQTPIILLSGIAEVPESALKLVDGFVGKGEEASQLLPKIVQLVGASKFGPQSERKIPYGGSATRSPRAI